MGFLTRVFQVRCCV